jgi:hypothetical protein
MLNFVSDGGNTFTNSNENFEEFPSEAIFSTDVHSGTLEGGFRPH